MPTLCSPPYFVSTTQRLSIPLFKFHITSFVHLFLTPLLFLYHGVCLYTRGLLLLFVFWYRYGCDYPALQQYLRGMRNHSAVTVRIPSPHPPCRVSHTYSSTSVLPHLYHYLDEGDACCNKVGGWPNKVGGWPDGRIQRQKVCTTSHLSVFFFFFAPLSILSVHFLTPTLHCAWCFVAIQVCDTYSHTMQKPAVHLADPGSRASTKAFNVCHPRMDCSPSGPKETEQSRMEDVRGTMHPKLMLLWFNEFPLQTDNFLRISISSANIGDYESGCNQQFWVHDCPVLPSMPPPLLPPPRRRRSSSRHKRQRSPCII